MFFDLLPEGGGVFAVLRFDHLDFLGGRGKRVAGDILGNPGPAQNGRCIETVGRYLEHAPHGEQATARNLGLEGDLAQALAIYAGYSVMLSEALVEEGKVGVDQASDGQVFPKQVIEVGFRFEGEVVIQKIIVEGVELEGRGNLVERAQIQPLVAEGMDHAFAFRVLDHAVDLGGNVFEGKFVRLGNFQALLIRHRKPESPGQ